MTETIEQPDQPEPQDEETPKAGEVSPHDVPDDETESIELVSKDGSLTREFDTDDPGAILTARALGWATEDEHQAGQAAADAHEAYMAEKFDSIGTEVVVTTSEGAQG